MVKFLQLALETLTWADQHIASLEKKQKKKHE